MAKMTGHNSGTMWLRRSYNFIDKDPEIDRFRTLRQKDRLKDSDLAVCAGIATATVKNIFGGKTRKPQHATFAKMAGAMGYKYDLVRDGVPNYEKEIPKAREEFEDYRVLLAKKRERQNGHRKNGNGHKKG